MRSPEWRVSGWEFTQSQFRFRPTAPIPGRFFGKRRRPTCVDPLLTVTNVG
jgi:hypothetical protein